MDSSFPSNLYRLTSETNDFSLAQKFETMLLRTCACYYVHVIAYTLLH